jgi:hypothetical protein
MTACNSTVHLSGAFPTLGTAGGTLAILAATLQE